MTDPFGVINDQRTGDVGVLGADGHWQRSTRLGTTTAYFGSGTDPFAAKASPVLNILQGTQAAPITGANGPTVKIVRSELISSSPSITDAQYNAGIEVLVLSESGNVVQPTAVYGSTFGYAEGANYVLGASFSAAQNAGAVVGGKTGGAMAVYAGSRSSVVGGSIIAYGMDLANDTGVDLLSSDMVAAGLDISVGNGSKRFGSAIQFRTGAGSGDAVMYGTGTWRTGIDMSGATISGLDFKGGGNSAFTGWVRVGSVSTPSNTTAGDLTLVRGFATTFDASTGYRIGGAAANRNLLIGNGTNFVSDVLVAGDVPGVATTAFAWTTVSYTAGDYTAATGTWTVDSGDLATFTYLLMGKTMVVSWVISTSSCSAATASVSIKIPASKSPAKTTTMTSAWVLDTTAGTQKPARCVMTAAGTTIEIHAADGANLNITANTFYTQGTVIFEVS